MSLIIEDGLGTGSKAKVDSQHRFLSKAIVNSEAAYVSLENQRTFNALFIDPSGSAGAFSAYMKNTSTTRNLVIDIIRVGNVENVLWKLVPATGDATGGTAVEPVNMNLGSGIEAEVTALTDNVGGFTAGTPFAASRVAANSDDNIPFDGTLIMPPNTAIAVEYDTGTTGICEVLMRFHFEDIDNA